MSGHVPEKETKILFARSGNLCAFPGCGQSLVESGAEEGEDAVVGEIAHLVAEKRRGPRGVDEMSDAERNRHGNLVLLCATHHKQIDRQPNAYTVPVLRQMKQDHEVRIEESARPHSVPTPQTDYFEETIQSTLLPVTHLPGAVFAAPCVYRQDQQEEVKRSIVYPKKRSELVPFLLREGKLYAFQDLGREDNPFSRVTDISEAEMLRAESLWEDPEGRRRYVQLLNRSLFKLAGRKGIRYDTEHRRFYFMASANGGERSFTYTSIKGRSATRRVAWSPKRKRVCEICSLASPEPL